MNNVQRSIRSWRPPFLILSPICVITALALCYWQGAAINSFDAFLAILGSISAAIAVNTINEYQDYHSGLDLITEQTPFSGGSGLLKQYPELSTLVFLWASVSLGVTFLIGLYFWQINNTNQIIPLGIFGLIIILTYTKWLNRLPILCYLSPGLGFGTLMISGTLITQGTTIDSTAIGIIIITSILISNLLLVNQFPDVEADKKVGRAHFTIRYGVRAASYLYLFSTIIVIATLIYLIFFDLLPILALLALLPLALNLWVFKQLILHGLSINQHHNVMKMNVISTNITPLMITLTLFIG